MRPRLPVVAPLMLLALWLAASPAARLAAQGAGRAVTRLPSFRNSIMLDTVAATNRTEHAAPPAVVWPLLADAVRSVDPELLTAGGVAAGWIGTPYLVTGRQLGNQRMSRWLECGEGMTGKYADTHRIALGFALFVDSLPGQRTRIGSALVASATSRGGESGQPVSCETTGALELEIRRRLDARLAATAPR